MRREVSAKEVEAALRSLDGSPRRVPAADWPAALSGLELPGLYSWWVDEAGAHDLSRGLAQAVGPGRIYAGQAGATKWPSGKRGAATLGSRIRSQHLGGRVRSSTFRLTLSAALLDELGLQVAGSKKLAPESEAQVTGWIRGHLELAVHVFDDRDALGALEDAVLDALDPPLNLEGRVPTPIRQRLSELRAKIANVPSMANDKRATPPRNATARRGPKPRGAVSQATTGHVTLHEEIAAILDGAGAKWMTTEELADAVNARGYYRKRDGSAVTAFQVHGRTRNYPELFEREGIRVRLR